MTTILNGGTILNAVTGCEIPGPVVQADFTTLTAATSPSWLDVSGMTDANSINRTLYDSTGKLTFAPNNLARQSETLTAWTVSGATASDASTLVSAATNAAHYAYSSIGNLIVGRTYFAAVDVKYVDYRYIGFRADQPEAYAVADLQTATISGSGGGAANVTLTDMGGGWYRISFTYVATGATAANSVVYFAANGTAAYTTAFNPGSAVSVNVRKLQQTAITYQTLLPISTYVATTTAAYYGPRYDYNPSTLASNGLLIEEARTNAALYSQDFSNAAWTAFGGAAKVGVAGSVSPDGTSNAYEVTLGTGGGTFNSASAIFQNLSYAAATTYTVSLWVRAKTGTTTVRVGMQIGNSYDSGDVSVTTTWTRITVSGASSGTATGNISIRTNVAGNSSAVFIWGAQYEIGSFATSYIPTTSASVTRAADIIAVNPTTIATFSSTQGAAIIEANIQNVVGSKHYFTSYNLNTAQRAGNIFFTSPTASAFYTNYTNSNPQYVISNSLSAGTMRMGYSFAQDNLSMAYNGVIGATDGSITPDVTPNRMWFFSFTAGVSLSTGWLRTFAYYTQNLPTAFLVAKSNVGAPL